MKEKTTKSTYDLRIKGALKLESQVIKVLKTICIVTFLSSLIMQYIIPLFFENSTLEIIHYEFLINVLLGVSCSAMVSLVCCWIPFVRKKSQEHRKLITLIRNVFFNYQKLLSIIHYNCNRNDAENTYIGEYLLIDTAKKLEQDANLLVSEYEKSDIDSQNIVRIIKSVDTVFLPAVGIVTSFVNWIMPKEYNDEPNTLFFTKKNKDFDKEENEEVYDHLKSSLDEMISNKELLDLFSYYIDTDNTEFEISRNSTAEQLEKTQKRIKENKAFNVRNRLLIKIMKTRDEHWQKRAKVELQNLYKE